MSHAQNTSFKPLNICVLTVSDTRDESSDTSGAVLCDYLQSAGHLLFERSLAKDDIYEIRAVVSRWITSPQVQVILITGGTGFSGRDSTPEAVTVLFDKTIEGFGELFRHVSFLDIGTSTVQSRAIAGMANKSLVVCMPGSTNACRTAWEKILSEQLDSRHRPCNFVNHLKRVPADAN